MTKTMKLTTLILSTGLFSGAAFTAFGEQQAQDYKVLFMKNCDVVSEQVMTNSQVESYLALREQEELMRDLEVPINAIEAQMHEYSAKIEELSALAIQETETNVYIDKTYMKQQEEVAHKLSQLVSSHQKDFDALHLQGNKISKVARVFEQEIESGMAHISYDQIQIIDSTKEAPQHNCYSGIYFH